MKKLLLVGFILTLAGSAFWAERRELARLGTERHHLRAELDRTLRQAADLEGESARLEATAVERERAVQFQQEKIVTGAVQRAAAATNAFGPPGGVAAWSEGDGFVWMEKRHLAALGVEAFRDADREVANLSYNTVHLLNSIGRQFFETHPEFANPASLTPEKADEFQIAYVKLLTEHAALLKGQEREAFEAAIRLAEGGPRPGTMAQPPADYRLNEDAATLLGLSTAERGVVADAVREMVGRYQEMERQHVAVSEEPVEEQASVPHPKASFRVAAFPDTGGALKEEWVSRLEAILGADRAAHFLEMSHERIRSEFGDFGTAERRITFVDGADYHAVTDKTTSGWSSGRGQSSPVAVPPGWRHLIARPADGGLPLLR